MGAGRVTKGPFPIFCFVCVLLCFLYSCVLSYEKTAVSIKNHSSQRISVEYKMSNSYYDRSLPETLVLDVREEGLLFEYGYGEVDFCDGPYQLEYIRIKDTHGKVRYSQDPVDPSLWTCPIEGGLGGVSCWCFFTITDELLNDPDDEEDDNIMDDSLGTDEFLSDLDDPDDDNITADSLEEDEDS